jgi:hypothetical protein
MLYFPLSIGGKLTPLTLKDIKRYGTINIISPFFFLSRRLNFTQGSPWGLSLFCRRLLTAHPPANWRLEVVRVSGRIRLAPGKLWKA